MGTKDFFVAIGLGTPFYYAAATYGFFLWLDRSASAQATRAISNWLSGKPYLRMNIHAAIISVFDRLYDPPLLRIGAFLRSATCSTIFFVIISLIGNVYSLGHGRELGLNTWLGWGCIFISLIVAISSDYVSLFFVRHYLRRSTGRPVRSLFASFFLGSIVIAIFYLLMFELIVALIFIYNGWLYDILNNVHFGIELAIYIFIRFPTTFLWLISPAFSVHLWLPLLGVGAIGFRFLCIIFRTVEWAQWFLKQGNRHPLRAIGMVAGALVFLVAGVWTLLALIV